jgi:signal transduction histidine kinase
MFNFALTPASRLIVATAVLLVTLVITVFVAVRQPFTGLQVAVQQLSVSQTDSMNQNEPLSQAQGSQAQVRLVGSVHANLPKSAELLSVQAAKPNAFSEQTPASHKTATSKETVTADEIIYLKASDFTEDPHFLATYADIQNLFERQTQLHELLRDHQYMTLGLRVSPEQPVRYYTVPVASHRPLSSLPAVFWFQLVVSSLGYLLGCWIWSLRPDDLGARIFALLNAMYPVFAFSAAIYSTRDMTLAGDLLHGLMILNTGGSLMYGSALMSLFLSYPQPLVSAKKLIWIPVFFMGWLLADVFFLLPAPSLGADLPVTLQMLSAIIFAIWQWRVNRNDARARVALRWFGVCVLVSCGLFVFLVQSIQLLGIETSLSQGYAFGFFLLVTIGIAVGLRRYRLFDLDQWAFGVLFWLAGAIVLILLDALLIMLLSPVLSFGLALLICGLLWLPVRGALQKQLFNREKISQDALFQAVLDISFASSGQVRSQQWQQLISRLFQPLELRARGDTPQAAPKPVLQSDGLVMLLPAVGDLPAFYIAYAGQGRRLFSVQDCQLMQQLMALIQRADESRFAYDQGVSEERSRIARDLHDDIGSRLLSGLYQQDITQAKQVIRQSIADMRTIIGGLTGTGLELDVVVESLHQEIRQRLQESSIQLDWTVSIQDGSLSLNYHVYKNYISILRELVSNLIKYAQAHQVSIEVIQQSGYLLTRMRDDGMGFDSGFNLALDPSTDLNIDSNRPTQDQKTAPKSYGLGNLKQRIEALNAKLDIQSQAGVVGTQVELTISLTLDH